jgi:flagellar biosynthesis protein FliR
VTMVFTAMAIYIGQYIAEIGPMFRLMLKASS